MPRRADVFTQPYTGNGDGTSHRYGQRQSGSSRPQSALCSGGSNFVISLSRGSHRHRRTVRERREDVLGVFLLHRGRSPDAPSVARSGTLGAGRILDPRGETSRRSLGVAGDRLWLGGGWILRAAVGPSPTIAGGNGSRSAQAARPREALQGAFDSAQPGVAIEGYAVLR